jgi:hypothetical protein
LREVGHEDEEVDDEYGVEAPEDKKEDNDDDDYEGEQFGGKRNF